MDRPARGVAGKLRHVEDFGDYSLSDKGGVPVDQYRNDLLAIGRIVKHPLSRARLALDHGIHGLQMARVCGQVDLDFVAGRGLPDVPISEVIFDVAVSTDRIRSEVSLEFVEDDVQRFVENIGQDVQPSPVGHAHDDLLDAAPLAVLNEGVQGQDQGFATLQGKALAAVLGMEKVLERFSLVEFSEDIAMDGRIGPEGSVAGLEFVEDPRALARVLNMHELCPDGPAVDGFQLANHVAQLHLPAFLEEAGRDRQIEFLFVEAELFEGQERVGSLEDVQRIEVCDGMAERAVGVDEGLHAGGEAIVCDCSRSEFRRVAIAVLLALGKAELETFEKGRPVGIDRLRVGAPAFVVVVDQSLAPPGGKSTHMQWLGWCPSDAAIGRVTWET